MGDPEPLICAALRGEPAVWSDGPGRATGAPFLATARDHGVLPLLDAAFLRRPALFAAWPEEIPAACHRAALAQAGFELAHGAEIDRMLAALAAEAITPLLLKGTGLAYGLYESPLLRPRSDSDLLVAPEMRDAAWQTLQGLGYRRIGGPAGRFVGYQLQAQRADARGIVHNIDLHWRIGDQQSFAWLFSFAELQAASVPVPALNPHAVRLGNAHALAVALLHRAGNNLFQSPGFGDRLIWLYDIHLLVGAMQDGELDDFRAMVEAKRIGAIALEGLRRCAERFPSPALAALIDALAQSPHAQSGADLLAAGRLRREWIEFRAIPGAGARITYLAERIFPSRDYMRERYPESPTSPLSILYLRRGLTGLRRLFLGGAPD